MRQRLSSAQYSPSLAIFGDLIPNSQENIPINLGLFLVRRFGCKSSTRSVRGACGAITAGKEEGEKGRTDYFLVGVVHFAKHGDRTDVLQPMRVKRAASWERGEERWERSWSGVERACCRVVGVQASRGDLL